MEIEFIQQNQAKIARVISGKVIISETQDALDLMADCSYQGAEKMILHSHHLAEAFFDLKSGIAGEILQKFSNYRVQLAIVGDFSGYTSKSLRDFIRESNRNGHILFVNSVEEARIKLS